MAVYKPREKVIFSRLLHNADGTPLQPDGDVGVRIMSPAGTVVTEGSAYISADGTFNFDWVVPEMAQASTDSRKWKVYWYCNVNHNPYSFASDFDVDNDIDRSFDRILLLSKGENTLFSIILDKRPDNDKASLVLLTTSDTQIAEYPQLIMTETPQGWLFETTEISTDYIASLSTDFLLKWNYKVSATPYTQIQRSRIAPTMFWSLLPELRILIDKLQKLTSKVQGYTDSDCYEYLSKGFDVLNRAQPTLTHWKLDNAPRSFWDSGFGSYLIEAAALWALHAQFLLGADLTFSFSGQTVTLEYDQTGPIADEISRLQDDINERWPQSKKIYIRNSSVGTVGLRERLVPWLPTLPREVNRGWGWGSGWYFGTGWLY